jgi:hypothetical protein
LIKRGKSEHGVKPLLIKRGEKLGGSAALAFRGDFFLINSVNHKSPKSF